MNCKECEYFKTIESLETNSIIINCMHEIYTVEDWDIEKDSCTKFEKKTNVEKMIKRIDPHKKYSIHEVINELIDHVNEIKNEM